MFHNYIKISLRNLIKHKTFSFINIFGLAASLSVCLLCILIVKDANSYDKFHDEAEKVFRINTTPIRKNGGTESYASSPYRVGQSLFEDYSQVEHWVPLVRTFNGDVRKNGNLLSGRGLYTNNDFFEMFGFEFENGDPTSALLEPYSVVLTNEFAKRIFKDDNPIGQSLELPAYDVAFKVTGVLKEFPGKTHLEFDALGSIATQITLEKQHGARNRTEDWLDYYSSHNYVKLKDGIAAEDVAPILADIAKTHYADLDLETRDAGYNFYLQPLMDITPGPILSNNMGNALPIQVLWFFGILSMIVMISACFNYTNLTIARSLTRAKEVGVRKVMGATRRQVFGQFISEAVIISLFSFGLGYLMLEFLIPGFNSIGTFASSNVVLDIDVSSVLMFLAFTILIGFIAGSLPATVLSKFSPLSVMQKLENVKLFRRVGLRKALVVFQFAVSLIFILVLTIAWKQIDFAVAENFGGDRTDIINLDMQGHSYEKLSAAFGQLPQVQQISASSHLMGTWADRKGDVRLKFDDEATEVREYAIDDQFIDNLGLKIIAGEGFSKNLSQQQEVFAIVNETFINQFDMESPQSAIGQSLILGDTNLVTIKGVTKDFLYKPLIYNLEPLLLRYDPNQLQVMHLTVGGSAIPETVAALERTWKGIDKERTISYAFYDETIAENFAEMKDLTKVVGFLGSLGLIIACLGLLGMAIYLVETKAKEISIRKVIGASAGDLVKQLSKGYMSLLIISIVVAVPVSYLIGSQMLNAFAFSISLNLWVFLPGVLILILLGVATIGSQTVKAAFANPAENLRSE